MDDPILRLSPPSLANLFDFEIKTSPSEFSYCKNLLHSLQFDRYLERIRSLSNTVEFKYTPPEERKPVEPGSIFVLHVEVVCERQKLKIIEKVRWLLARTCMHTNIYTNTHIIYGLFSDYIYILLLYANANATLS